jgi:hypothetical protein
LAKDLSNWTYKQGSWALEDGALARKGGGDIWTKERFGDFILELEFKVDKDTNSGVFFRTDNISDPVQTGIEVQILDSDGKTTISKYDCGAIYDCLAPSKNMVKAPLEWNRLTITARANQITVIINSTAQGIHKSCGIQQFNWLIFMPNFRNLWSIFLRWDFRAC